MSTEPRFWFRAKPYGLGWGLPVCWQGWVVFLGYLALVFGGLHYLAGQHASLATLLVYTAVPTIFFVAIVAITGEKPFKWRWGGN